VGDHGCEYMTGGRVVILGRTGRNFGAGMSGGIAYVLDEGSADGTTFEKRCNLEMIGLGRLEDPEEIEQVLGLIRKHAQLTGSEKARRVLERWPEVRPLFVRVIPQDYRRVLEAQKAMLLKGMTPEEAEMAAFEKNSKDASRLHGK
jgi:glutamate synthase (ferredoxin)